MAQPNTSFGASIGLAEEVTYGTPVGASNWLEIISTSLDREIDRQPEPTLGRAGDAGHVPRRKYTASDNVGGAISFVMSYDDSTLMMLKHALGSVSTSGAGPFAHSITLDDLPIGLTINKLTPDQSEVFEGCKITDWTISVGATELMTCDVTIIGETSGGLVVATNPSYSATNEEIRHHQAGQLTFNAVSYDITSISIAGSNGVDRRQVLGSSNTKEPTPTAKREIVFSVEYEWLANTLHAAFLAGTESDLEITFTGTTNNSLAITGHNAYIRSVSTPIQGPGVITQTVEFVCQSDGTDLGIELLFGNDNALATAN
jgi:hypothetical protein